MAILITAWAAILIIALHKIILQEVFKVPVSENLQYFVTGISSAAGLALTLAWKRVRSLRLFFLLFLVLAAVQWLVYTRVDSLPTYRAWIKNPSFNVYMFAEQSLNLMVALAVIAFLFAVKKRRGEFFLVRGNLAAPVEPVKWLGVGVGTTWAVFGRILALCLSLGTLAFLVIAGRPPLDVVIRALPFLPAVLLAAACNAFFEEMAYKASLLSVLNGAVSRSQALLLTAASFGIMHYYGIPYGIVGVLMASFLGWLLAKSMVETGGLFWAWFLHFLQDVLIFSFLAIGSIAAGGG